MKLHEALIAMTIGASMFAPIASTAQNATGSSPTAGQTTTPQPPYKPAAVANQPQVKPFVTPGVITGTQPAASCPVGCPPDPGLSMKLDVMGNQIANVQSQIAELRKQISELQRQVTAQNGTDTNITNRLIKLEGTFQHHTHFSVPQFDWVQMPSWDCDKYSGCKMNGKTATVATMNPATIMNSKTSAPLPQ